MAWRKDGRRHGGRLLAVLAAGLLAVAAVAPATLAAQSQGDGAGQDGVRTPAVRPYPMMGGWWALGQELGLTDQQRQEIRRIELQLQEQLLPVRTELFQKRQELALALRQDQPDASRVRALVQDIGRLRTEIQAARTEALLRIRSVLTPQQREKLQALGWGGWVGHVAGGPMGGRAGMGMRGRWGGGFCPGPGGGHMGWL